MKKNTSTIYSEEDFTTRVPQNYWALVESASIEYAEKKSATSSGRGKSRSFNTAKSHYEDLRTVSLAETFNFVY